MPQIIMGPGLEKIDGSLYKATYNFLMKLASDDTTPGLHIEPINNSVDKRARTGRVDLSNRAVLFKLQGTQQDASYVFIGTFPHDEAISIAQKSRVRINPRNGVAELIPIESPPVHQPEETHAPQSEQRVETAPHPAPAHPAEPSEKALRTREFTTEDLTELGIDPAFAEGALDITGADAILEYAATAPATWQGNALLDIYTGESLAVVRDKYALTENPTVDDDNDDAVLQALRHPAAQMEFAFIEDNDALRTAIENPDFAAWRIFLHPEQRAYTTRNYNGSFRLTGGAGTGKTVVLLHRARHLHRQNPQARIVLTTYNTTLAEGLKTQLEILDPHLPQATDIGQPGIYIAGVDAIAHRIITTNKPTLTGDTAPGAVAEVLGPRTAHITTPTGPQAWSNAAVHSDLPEHLRTPSFLSAEYATIVLPHNVTTRTEYLKVRRPGRGVALNRKNRNAVWDIIETYRANAAADGTADFEEKASIAAKVLHLRGDYPADHVLVDEAQDLSPNRFTLLRALVAEGPNDLFLAEDAHQRIYGQKIVLSHYGINIRGRSRRLTLNYRTTEQNLRYALGILTGIDYTDLANETENTTTYRSARRGPTPHIIAADSLSDEYDIVAKLVNQWTQEGAAPDSIGLLVPTRKEGETLPRALGDRGVTVTYIDRDTSSNKNTPQVMTMHRSKGMEFTKVILVGVGADNLPRQYQIDALPEGDRDDALQRERSLLYVAATRARDELIVIYPGKPSELLPQ
ncbi:AAA family ATPase [Hoyosella rhizosphaerae]|uniref:DNA 3'-5' helicase n=1 Tax=Hoyosella rhizosphaerae TaxID=1755582 RepID=A0A916UI41_9ACTN|nr:3'-5' exonuclease [Hoyosella rhizosphaerae]MBN4928291.1 AAA family ATPase [Hoyosella rhizosphaerae]GGC73860.1 DNA helicase [Hoyosella rhizosphaerae]